MFWPNIRHSQVRPKLPENLKLHICELEKGSQHRLESLDKIQIYALEKSQNYKLRTQRKFQNLPLHGIGIRKVS